MAILPYGHLPPATCHLFPTCICHPPSWYIAIALYQWQLNPEGKLLHVQIVRHVGVDGLADESGPFIAESLAPFRVVLGLRLDGFLSLYTNQSLLLACVLLVY